MKFKNQYGAFSDDLRQYHIRDLKTPRPWCNVIANRQYGFVVSQTGGGFSFFENSNLNRVTRYEQDMIEEKSGKYLFVNDSQSGQTWSLTPLPCLPKYSSYECVHGLGYTVLKTVKNQLAAELLLTVDKQEAIEIWKLTLTNRSNRGRSAFVASYFEWLLGPWPDCHREFHKLFIETKFSGNALFASKRIYPAPGVKEGWNSDYPFVAFHAVSPKPSSFTGDKETFIGSSKRLADPQGVVNRDLGRSQGHWGDGIGSLGVTVNLKPGASKEIVFVLGVSKTTAAARTVIKRTLADPDKVIAGAKEYFSGLTAKPFVKTPDPDIDGLVNYWLPYQTISSRIQARTGYYQSSGAFGFRDQLQDSHIFLPQDPARTRKQILLHANHQYYDGTVFHWWHPKIDEGPKSEFSDDLLWLGFVTFNYLKETGDYKILNEVVPYHDKGKDTLLAHILKAIDLAIKRRSKRGLFLIGEGDWNDGLSSTGDKWKGETVWLGMFMHHILRDLIVVLEKINKPGRIAYFKKLMNQIDVTTNRLAWDGGWYTRATTDDGKVLGSKKCKYGKIFLNAQIWSILSGLVPDSRKANVIKSVRKYLDRKYGPVLLWPSYAKADPSVGYLTRYAPGARENGGLYTHAGVWALWTACFLKDRDWAYDMYRRFSPVLRGRQPNIYYVEPYVTPGNVDGPDSPNFGRGGWTWYTGSSSWLHRILCEWFLGIRPEWNGLVIEPCVPIHWKKFTMTRVYRGKTCRITYKQGGKPGVFLNGHKLNGNVIAPQQLRLENDIIVRG